MLTPWGENARYPVLKVWVPRSLPSCLSQSLLNSGYRKIGLCNKCQDPRFLGCLVIERLIVAADQDHSDVRPLSCHDFGYIYSVHFGHLHISQHQVWEVGLYSLESVGTIPGFADYFEVLAAI